MNTCASCKHSSAIQFLWWTIGSSIDMKCRHPIVNREIWNASNQGFIIPSYLEGGPLYDADYVTGRPAYAVVSCMLARSAPFKISGRETRDVTFLCMPEGRYWEPRT